MKTAQLLHVVRTLLCFFQKSYSLAADIAVEDTASKSQCS